MGVEDLKKQKEALKRVEDKTIPGAPVLTPKEILLNADEAIAKNPDKRVRWVNIKTPEKARSREAQGYRRLSAEEGGKSLGDALALFAKPRELYERDVARQKQLNKERLSQHNREMEQMADQVAQILRDKHGIKISAEKLLIHDEG